MTSNTSEPNRLRYAIRHSIAPLLLILFCPPMVMVTWYTSVFLDGSVLRLWHLFVQEGFFTTIYRIWAPLFFGTPDAWKMIALFIAAQLLFMKVLPGRSFQGPITPKGNIPLYKTN